jgi:hypothetical protein
MMVPARAFAWSHPQALLEYVPRELRGSCQSVESPFGGEYPGLACAVSDYLIVWYYGSPNTGAMNTEFERTIRLHGLSPGSCSPTAAATFKAESRFTIDGTDAGSVGCYIDSAGDPRMVWTSESLGILSYAIVTGPSDLTQKMAELYDFWSNRAGPR